MDPPARRAEAACGVDDHRVPGSGQRARSPQAVLFGPAEAVGQHDRRSWGVGIGGQHRNVERDRTLPRLRGAVDEQHGLDHVLARVLRVRDRRAESGEEQENPARDQRPQGAGSVTHEAHLPKRDTPAGSCVSRLSAGKKADRAPNPSGRDGGHGRRHGIPRSHRHHALPSGRGGPAPGCRCRPGAITGAVGRHSAARTPDRGHRGPGLDAGDSGRPLPRRGFPHPRGDGRLLVAAAQAAGRPVVRYRRRVDRRGDPDDDRLGLCAHRPAGDQRRLGQPDRSRARRGRRRAGRAEPAIGHHQDDPAPADAHSELLGSYPWGETTPSQSDVNLPDSADVRGPAPGLHRPGYSAGLQQ